MGRSSVRRPLGALIALLALLMLGLSWIPASPAQAAPLPAPVTDYDTYPAGILPAGCGGGFLTGLAFTVGGTTAPSLAGFSLTPGTVVDMSWSGFTANCSAMDVSLAVKRADGPTFDPTTNQELLFPFDHCGPAAADRALRRRW